MSPHVEDCDEEELSDSSGNNDEEDGDDDGFYKDMEALKRACILTGSTPKKGLHGDTDMDILVHTPPQLQTAPHSEDYKKEEFFNDDDDDDEGFDEDMECLRRAYALTGRNPNDIETHSSAAASYPDSDDSSEADDFELLQNIKKKYSVSANFDDPLCLKPLSYIQPCLSDDGEEDFEILRAVKRRFQGYDNDALTSSTEHYLQKPEQVRVSSIASEKETSIELFVNRTNACERFPDSEDACNIVHNLDLSSDKDSGIQSSGLIECGDHNLSTVLHNSSFPKSAHVFMDAINKNRTYQKFLRIKLKQIEVKIEENKKLIERVKTLKDFQSNCKRKAGRALSQKKDPQVQLFSAPKVRKDSKVNHENASPIYFVPEENSHVANYRMVLKRFPLSFSREKWSDAEKEDLRKGLTQEFQKTLLEKSGDLLSGAEGSSRDSNDADNVIASIKGFEITPEIIRSYLPKVDWGKLARVYVKGRSGAECEARWLNFEDPLINHNEWTNLENKYLLCVVQQRGFNNWIDIAVSLGTNRTPFQCLAHYQRSLNASILKREWNGDEDNQLRAAVETFGEGNWLLIASTLKGRIGSQCSNRYNKSLHPVRRRVGRWTADEDRCLRVAATLFGAKTWKKISEFVPGRNQVQCRERWVNCLDPCLSMGEFTEREDSRLKAAITEHGFSWSRVAECVPPRTDNQCRRRWMALFPDEVPLLQAARKIQKAALISNFVDRESERPDLGPVDFLPLLPVESISQPENVNPSKKRKRKSQSISEPENANPSSKPKRNSRSISESENANPSRKQKSKSRNVPKSTSRRGSKKAHILSKEVVAGRINNSDIGETLFHSKKRSLKPCSKAKHKECSSIKDLGLETAINRDRKGMTSTCERSAPQHHDTSKKKKKCPKPLPEIPENGILKEKGIPKDSAVSKKDGSIIQYRRKKKSTVSKKDGPIIQYGRKKISIEPSSSSLSSGVCRQVEMDEDDDNSTLACMLKRIVKNKDLKKNRSA